MVLHEKLKTAKITEEITGYLLERGYYKLSIDIELNKQESKFVITVEDKGENLIDVFKNDLYCCREIELEEYGVDQLHNECVCSLNTLGMLVDGYEIELKNGKYEIILHRKQI